MKRYALILIMFLLGIRISFADTIYLKNGKKVEGKIIEKTQDRIKVDISGAKITYFTDEVEHIEETNKKRLSVDEYVQKMIVISEKLQNESHSKLIVDGREISFAPKSNPVMNAAAIGYYEGGKSFVEEVQRELLSINPPVVLIENYELFKKSVSYRIAAYEKAMEAHQKDDISIMEIEGADLLKKSGDAALEASRVLEEWKRKVKEI